MSDTANGRYQRRNSCARSIWYHNNISKEHAQWAAENPGMQDATYSTKKRAKRPSTPKKVKQQRLASKLSVAQGERLSAVDAENKTLRAQLAALVGKGV